MNERSTYLPAVFFKIGQQVIHFVGLPIFFFLFIILYRPFSLEILLSFPLAGFAFNAAIVSAILLMILAASRLTLWGLRNVTSFKRRTYLLWCIGEIIVSSLFIALYVALISQGKYEYIEVLPFVLVFLAAILIFPYLLLTLVLESDLMQRYIQPEADLSRLRFYDDKHNLKFVTQPAAVLYIESDENYCNIVYTEGAQIKKFSLRATMKSLEENCSKHGILRCHRKYFINTERIKVLRKEREGLNIAEMDVPGIDVIPVTLRYYDQISQRL